MQGNREFASVSGAKFPMQLKTMISRIIRLFLMKYHILIVYAAMCVGCTFPSVAQQSSQSLELTRTIRSWEFLPVVGTRAGIFGNETGRFEAWVYPLKIFRELHLTFHVGDRALPAESLARTLTVHPESASILYVGDSFRVRETLCVPVNEPGAVILLDVE